MKIARTSFTDEQEGARNLFPGGDNRSAKGLTMLRLLNQFCKDQSGATAIEYGLIAAGISVAIIATVQALGSNLNTTFSAVSTAIK